MLVAIDEFQKDCLKFLEQIQHDGEQIVITRSGEPVAKLVAVNAEEPKSVFGIMKGTVTIHGDITGPVGEEWEA